MPNAVKVSLVQVVLLVQVARVLLAQVVGVSLVEVVGVSLVQVVLLLQVQVAGAFAAAPQLCRRSVQVVGVSPVRVVLLPQVQVAGAFAAAPQRNVAVAGEGWMWVTTRVMRRRSLSHVRRHMKFSPRAATSFLAAMRTSSGSMLESALEFMLERARLEFVHIPRTHSGDILRRAQPASLRGYPIIYVLSICAIWTMTTHPISYIVHSSPHNDTA